ncbi:MAG: hypothetical protein HY710_05890 [Candidatus Latescibacteria bacterium]|nr:hypothetical protein [Candidatus Latescibacterota bacterium]
MVPFHEHLLDRVRPIWDAILHHRFLAAVADNSIDRQTFVTWMQQDYLFVREAVPLMALTVSKAPVSLRRFLSEALIGLHNELDLFEALAAEHGVTFHAVEMAPTCHAYHTFLLATGHTCSFPEKLTTLYGAEKAYLDAWVWVKTHQRAASPWQRFIDHWSSPGFAGYVDTLARHLDDAAARCSDDERARMETLFRDVARYEYRFWEMAATGERWDA